MAIPSNGPPVSRADLESFKTKIDTMVSRATGLVKQGVPKNQLMAQLKTSDLGSGSSVLPEISSTVSTPSCLERSKQWMKRGQAHGQHSKIALTVGLTENISESCMVAV